MNARCHWDSIKGFIRSYASSYSSRLNKAQPQKSQQIHFSEQTAKSLTKTKVELNLLLMQRADFVTYKNGMNHFSNRPSRLLANKLKTNDQFTNIAIIASETGSMISDPELINQRFSNFYKELYTSDNISSASEKDNHLQKLKLTSLSTDEASILGAPLSLDELKQSLAKMNKGRSPGNDGIHPEVYLKFWSLLGPPLLEMFNTAIQKGCFGRDVNTALITLLLKKDKDPSNCAPCLY